MSKVDELIAKLEGLKINHNTSEDPWYSCPKSEEGCYDDHQEGCTCGADKHNAEVDSLITWVRSNIA
jgi:hypothetical protein